MKIFEIIVDYKNTAYKARLGQGIDWYKISHGGYYEIDTSEVPKEVKVYVKKLRKVK